MYVLNSIRVKLCDFYALNVLYLKLFTGIFYDVND